MLSWTWNGNHTKLHKLRFGPLPARATISVTCRGPGCSRRPMVAGSRHLRRLIKSLEARVFHAGQRLTITISASGWTPERALLKIRDGKLPVAKLV
jgi:hypothetical protein